MTPERVQAYRRVIHTLRDLGPGKLFDGEQERIRDAADNLIFSRGLLEDDAALNSLGDIELLCRGLVDSGRWERVTATRLADDIAACGPLDARNLKAA
jgi:hypothetical protein